MHKAATVGSRVEKGTHRSSVLKEGFATFIARGNASNNVVYPNELLPMKTFVGTKELMVGIPIQLLLNSVKTIDSLRAVVYIYIYIYIYIYK